MVTRAESADGPLSRELRSLGLTVLLWPAVSLAAGDTSALEAALARLADFDWIVFASRQAVAAVLERVPRLPAHLSVAAVGQATAQVLRQRGWPVDLVPDEPSAAALVDAFAAQLAAGAHPPRVLFPASSRALPTIAAGLRQLGAEVDAGQAYGRSPRAWTSTAAAPGSAVPDRRGDLRQSLGRDRASRRPGTRGLRAPALRGDAVAIGRTTARELAARGHESVVAASATLHGLALTTARLVNAPAGTS